MAKIIQLTGNSGTGKSSISKRLQASIIGRGYEVEELIEPGPLRDFAKSYRLREDKNPWTEVAIYTTDRTILYEEKVFPRMSEPNLVFVAERGFFDTFVYQGLLGGVDLEVIKRMNSHIPFPDLTLALVVDGKVGYERISARSMETGEPMSQNETPDRINLLSKYFRSLEGHFPESSFEFIDTTNLSEVETFEDCYSKIRRVL